MALADSLRGLARSGTLRVVVSDAFVRHAVQSGRRIREYTAMPGDVVQCTVSADDDYLVARLGADLTGAARVDLSFSTPQGAEIGRLADIPINPDTGTVLYQESIAFAQASPDNSLIMRLLTVDADGGERVLGEYAFHHTRTIPGPPALVGAGLRTCPRPRALRPLNPGHQVAEPRIAADCGRPWQQLQAHQVADACVDRVAQLRERFVALAEAGVHEGEVERRGVVLRGLLLEACQHRARLVHAPGHAERLAQIARRQSARPRRPPRCAATARRPRSGPRPDAGSPGGSGRDRTTG